MGGRRRDGLFWAPRALILLFAGFVSSFALDALEGPLPVADKLAALAVHLIPTALILGLLAVAWRWERLGGLLCLVLAACYVLFLARGRLDWSLLFAGPLVLAGVLFLAGGGRGRGGARDA